MNIFLTLVILFVFLFLVLKTKLREGLENYGVPDDAAGAPFGYRKIVNNLKYPSEITDTTKKHLFHNLLNHVRYNNHVFNHKSLEKLYGNDVMMNDFKHFNNTSNIILYHYNNNQ